VSSRDRFEVSGSKELIFIIFFFVDEFFGEAKASSNSPPTMRKRENPFQEREVGGDESAESAELGGNVE